MLQHNSLAAAPTSITKEWILLLQIPNVFSADFSEEWEETVFNEWTNVFQKSFLFCIYLNIKFSNLTGVLQLCQLFTIMCFRIVVIELFQNATCYHLYITNLLIKLVVL